MILGADVLYERRLVPLVAGLLARMLAPDGIALIADPYRVAAEGFARGPASARAGVRGRAGRGRDRGARAGPRDAPPGLAAGSARASRLPVRPEGADDLGRRGRPRRRRARPVSSSSDPPGGGRVGEGGRADLDGRGAGDEEFQGVVGARRSRRCR